MAEKEYIERGAALRAIGYTSIEPSKEPDIIELTLLTAQKMLKKLPTADVVEVVRCRDCVNWGGVVYNGACRKFSGIYKRVYMDADNFCSCGKRKE